MKKAFFQILSTISIIVLNLCIMKVAIDYDINIAIIMLTALLLNVISTLMILNVNNN